MMEDRVLQVLEETRESLLEEEPENLHASEEVYDRYQSHFRPGEVASLSEEVLTSFLSYENNQHWTNLQRQRSALTSDMGLLREALSILVDEERPLSSRFTEVIQKVDGMGRATATAVLHVAYPERYGVWNKTSHSQMDRLDLLPKFEAGATVGQKYEEINEVLLFLAEELSLDLWTLDILWDRLKDAETDAEEDTASPTSGTSQSDLGLGEAFNEVLSTYVETRRSKPPTKTDEKGRKRRIHRVFDQIGRLIEESPVLEDRPQVEVRPSLGHGAWIYVPWIALLDHRETDTPQAGTYLVYLFREDMSGVYLTYSQGVTKPTGKYGQDVGMALVQNRMERVRRRSKELTDAGFTLGTDIDLRTETRQGQEWEKSTIAYKFYEEGKIPTGEVLLSDLGALTQSYDRYVSEKESRPSIQLDRTRLEEAVANVIRPAVQRGAFEEGDESYQHDKIIPEATPELTPENLSKSPREAVLGALDADVNLLHHTYQQGFAEEFFQQAEPEQIREEVSRLLYAPEDLTSRVRRFLEWGSKRETEKGKTAKLGSTTASYLLCLSDPQEYAFCKTQKAYRPAAKALLSEEEIPSSAPERVTHARAFYKKVLSVFEEEYPELSFFDLMHVHIAFFNVHATDAERWGKGDLNGGQDPKTVSNKQSSERDRDVYKVATGDEGKYWDDFKEEGHFRVGWDEVGDLRQYQTKQDFQEAFYEEYLDSLYDGRKQKASEKAGELWTLREMGPGDRIVANQGESQVLGVGTVTEKGYEWKPDFDGFCHAVHVDWEAGYEQRIESRPHWGMKTVKQLPSDFIEENLESSPEPYSVGKAVEGLFYDRSDFESWLGRLRKKKNLILQGPPGVGKTFVSKRLAYALMGEKADGRTEMIQLHQSYAYEDFIRGYRPTEDEGFRLKDGVFFRFCDRAREDPDRDYVFIIDEINRGNLSKVFGEVMMLIETDKRGPGQAVQLSNRKEQSDPYGNRFYVPENLYLLGMMNTADRSLAMVDYALRRRFAFVEMGPRFGTDRFQDHLRKQGASDELIDQVVSRLQSLNEEIADDDSLGEGFRIGHSYFCPEKQETPNQDWYEEVVTREIEPLLKEYWFDDQKKAESHVEDLKG